jgi:ATP-dependent RNA helicase DDX21
MVNFGLRVARGHGLSVSHASIPSRKNTLCFRGRFGDSLPVVRAARTFATSADSDTEVGVVGSENVGGLEGGLEGVDGVGGLDGVDGVDGARTSFDSTLGFQSVDFALEDDDALAPVEDESDAFDSDVETEDEVLSSSFASLFTDGEASDADEVVDENLLVRNCGLKEETVAILESRGIKALFPIQKAVFEPIKEGRDVVARAKTGSGKTLAFAVPVVEQIQDSFQEDRKPRGRAPQCIVLAPTRELAKQVEREIQAVAGDLFVGCFYGGTSIVTQKRMLERGVDIAVGTPGRVIDLIEQNALDLSNVKYVVLDEADQMLNVGFEQDVEDILKFVPEERQTMMFSATIPRWVKGLISQYLKDPVNIDNIGEGQTGKLNENITAYGVQVTSASRRSILVDLITVHADGGKAIVFTQTKRDCDEVAAAVALHLPCEPLHGDMAQAERERVLASFRAGRTNVLVATDVAARGLDIPEVDLVVHYELPRESESFLHRSGRTGRAGRSGTTIAMYSRNEIGTFKRILRETKTKGVTTITPPTPQQVVEAAAKQVMYRLDNVEQEVRSYFSPVAKMVLASRDPQEALEVALAALSGITAIPEPRSLLTLQEGFTTLQMMSERGRITRIGHIPAIVTKLLDSRDKGSSVGRIQLLDDEKSGTQGAAFDVPKALAEEIIANKDELESKGVTLTIPTYVLH